jgi:hypothetical protein
MQFNDPMTALLKYQSSYETSYFPNAVFFKIVNTVDIPKGSSLTIEFPPEYDTSLIINPEVSYFTFSYDSNYPITAKIIKVPKRSPFTL